ncbi:MAG TPA: hypothetical protein VGA78_14415 [Gemmatimonadales bacterium]
MAAMQRLLAGLGLRAALIVALLGVGVIGVLAVRSAGRRGAQELANQPDAPVLGADGKPIAPPLPAPGTLDSLQGLVVMPPESLPRFETREHGYEEESVVVYRRQGDWYLVGLRDGGRAWVSEHGLGAFYPLNQLVVNRLNWLTESWDTRLRQVPDLTAPAVEVDVPRARRQETPATVLEARPAGGTLWFRVEVLDTSPCEGGTPRVVATGWIPAWGSDGKPTAWFYSRGC